MPSDIDSGMVTIISVRLKSKSLLRKEIYGDFEKSLKSLENGARSKKKKKCDIGISIVEKLVQGNYSPPP